MSLSLKNAMIVWSTLAALSARQATADVERTVEAATNEADTAEPSKTIPMQSPTAPAIQPDLPRFVVTLDQLQRLTERDAVVTRKLSALYKARYNARSILAAGLVGGIGAFAVGGVLALSCADEIPKCDDGSTLMPVGIGVAVLGIIGWAVASPHSRSGFVDVINAWNSRHPTQPIYPH